MYVMDLVLLRHDFIQLIIDKIECECNAFYKKKLVRPSKHL